MLNNAKILKGYKLKSLNGKIGKVKEFYFDDQSWAIRYLVADTGSWLIGRDVLIPPYALISVIKEKQQVDIDLTRKQIEESPSMDSDKPVSRQLEEICCRYYGWSMYRGGKYRWGANPYITYDHEDCRESTQGEKAWDPHLRSTQNVSGHNIQATDGEIGHVEDFIIDDYKWAIRYLIINTRNWWPGKNILVSPQWIERISWSESKVFINLTREIIKKSPEYTEQFILARDYEAGLHQNHNHKGYWPDKQAAKMHSL